MACQGQCTSSDHCPRLFQSNMDAWHIPPHHFEPYILLFGADSEFKARGVILQYSGGAADFCSNGQGDAVQRSLSLAVECDPKQTLNIFENVVVVERDNCQYEAQLQSVHGCPVVCKSGSGASTSVCNGHGVCGYNEAASRAQCYCSEGFKGSTCQDRA